MKNDYDDLLEDLDEVAAPSWALDPGADGTSNGEREEFEASAVMRILKTCGMASGVDYLKREALARTGVSTINFALFHHLAPNFPIRLGVAGLYDPLEPLTMGNLLRLTKGSPVDLLCRSFQKWLEEDPGEGDGPRGMIFWAPGLELSVLHNYQTDIVSTRCQARIPFGRKERCGRGYSWILEPLDQFLAAVLGTGWNL